ncbi:hypothetical protein LY28_02351 [Ruminiclostridium sufflavum DSM 19573]|uniref:Uncharacterized protein n=1 Tax=Ruminiclostridium sufflavum DSM 19573 TaxID=1121337 RepID=A0A318XLF1_9FIRM|nr:hypothetical protein [Ruminiclostridium sufflavum]PYG87213.1 hypothetical protein LY28_02351 [Ruminiclostridium sufflavum DSM 19573]
MMCGIDNNIRNGIAELYKILKENCAIYDEKFRNMVVREIETKSNNKNLTRICINIMEIIKSEKG